MESGYPIPRSVVRHVGKCVNLGLFLDRFLKYPVDESLRCPWKWSVVVKRGERAADQKFRAWETIESTIVTSFRQTKATHEAVMERRSRLLDRSSYCRAISMRLKTRLAVGLGGASVMENGISLHRVFGFPVINGSAVKGVCAHWKFCQIAESLLLPPWEAAQLTQKLKDDKAYRSPWRKLEEALAMPLGCDAAGKDKRKEAQIAALGTYRRFVDAYVKQYREENGLRAANEEEMAKRFADFHREYQMLFGSTVHKGCVVFGDAYPTTLFLQNGEPIVEIDLVNPHYSQYYRNADHDRRFTATDSDSPIISNFLTVAAGTTFQFFVQADSAEGLAAAESLVAEAIPQTGMGAKTSANYGWFDLAEK